MDKCKPLHGGARRGRGDGQDHGKAVQADPIKPTLKPTGTKRLGLKRDVLISTFAFKFNLRRYTTAALAEVGAGRWCCLPRHRVSYNSRKQGSQ